MAGFTILKKLEENSYGGRFSVTKYLVRAPNGVETEMFLRSGADFAVVVPVLDDETVIMVEQPRLGLEKPSLEFPMGQVSGSVGQAIAETELREETGYTSTNMRLLGSLLPSPGWNTQKALIYVAENLVEGPPSPEPLEFITVKKVPFTELHRLIQDNSMVSMATIAAFHMYLGYKKGLK